MNFDFNKMGRCCECMPGTVYDSTRDPYDKCSCPSPGADLDYETMTCNCDSVPGATFRQNTGKCGCEMAKGTRFNEVTIACECIDANATFEIAEGRCICDIASEYIDPVTGNCF